LRFNKTSLVSFKIAAWNDGSLHSYWRKCRTKIDREHRKTFDGVMIYFWWNVWKECNRRTFQNKSMQPNQVVMLCKEDLQQYQLATRPDAEVQQS
jgi:hypothetical protein